MRAVFFLNQMTLNSSLLLWTTASHCVKGQWWEDIWSPGKRITGIFSFFLSFFWNILLKSECLGFCEGAWGWHSGEEKKILRHAESSSHTTALLHSMQSWFLFCIQRLLKDDKGITDYYSLIQIFMRAQHCPSHCSRHSARPGIKTVCKCYRHGTEISDINRTGHIRR